MKRFIQFLILIPRVYLVLKRWPSTPKDQSIILLAIRLAAIRLNKGGAK